MPSSYFILKKENPVENANAITTAKSFGSAGAPVCNPLNCIDTASGNIIQLITDITKPTKNIPPAIITRFISSCFIVFPYSATIQHYANPRIRFLS